MPMWSKARSDRQAAREPAWGEGKVLSALTQSDTLRQFSRYSVVGLSGFFVDFGTYWILTRCFSFWRTYLLVANAIAFTLAVINNFTWHKLWTFRGQKSVEPAPDAQRAQASEPGRLRRLGGQFATFALISVIGLGLNTTILATVYRQALVQSIFGSHADLFAKVIATGVVWFWNFGANKFWTFRQG